MIERLRQLVETPSLSGQEADVVEVVVRELRAAGLSLHRSGNNAWCECGDAPRPRLLLNSHLDTVPPGNDWKGDPWKLRESDGNLIGLGANDAKGCVTALLETFLAVHKRVRSGRPLGGTLVLALTAEEETSGAGLGTIVDALRPLDAAIVGEPTGLVPMIAQRGLLILRCIARGRTAHPANTPPAHAENAIVAAAAQIQRLAAFDWGPAHPLLGPCHANVTTIAGGRARNVIPDACEFVIDVRTTPLESHAAIVARLRAALDCEVHVHSDRLVPVSTAPDASIVRAAQEVLPGRPPAASAAMSDMVYLAGVDAIKLGPGQSQRSHTPEEFIHADELAAGAAAYGRMIDAFFESSRRVAEPAVANAPRED